MSGCCRSSNVFTISSAFFSEGHIAAFTIGIAELSRNGTNKSAPSEMVIVTDAAMRSADVPMRMMRGWRLRGASSAASAVGNRTGDSTEYGLTKSGHGAGVN